MNSVNKMSKLKIETSQYFQILDRLDIISKSIDDHLLQHKVCKLEKDVTKKVESAIDSLYEARLEVEKILKDRKSTRLNSSH